ncbi:membrane complex biogenesis protein, BtpA family [Rubidibacter lacunae KORDI 51-2]|uniref:Membrane complex biogenesis protein, BtpA family n=1 Tax=Rubidibacter lacunae KORDI 51-2 TaxID=582515 RepID=U5DLZ8_9CHRO|nr:BtpA/SgcQ family protein [Rubidibacter lacunae]ERN41584.1 membrane complex biogenesis protein, BtpA family [Rubidibacter lacunae KORDI 51-2]
MNLEQLFETPKPVIGVVHLLPLPASARWGSDLEAILERAEQEASALAAGGADGIIIENFHDAPFPKNSADPATVSAITLAVHRIKQIVVLPIGINVLRNDARSALAIAACTGAQFVRVNVLTGVMATDQGLIEGQAHHLLRYRRELGADVAIFADVLVKHARPLNSPHLTAAVSETIERGLADAAILSGWATGEAPSYEDLEVAKAAAGDTPILVGSGTTWDNIAQLLQAADGAIAASSLKRNGRLSEPIDPTRVRQFVEAARLEPIAPVPPSTPTRELSSL